MPDIHQMPKPQQLLRPRDRPQEPKQKLHVRTILLDEPIVQALPQLEQDLILQRTRNVIVDPELDRAVCREPSAAAEGLMPVTLADEAGGVAGVLLEERVRRSNVEFAAGLGEGEDERGVWDVEVGWLLLDDRGWGIGGSREG